MKNEQPLDLQSRIEALDSVPAEPVPAGWTRRNWVQRDALAFAALAAAMITRRKTTAE